ncbi:hypothetical protein M427DRAFT_43577 [Gonapodya prolifera JEL478]|uniref:Uncharacterized protein n=1 Tax=Gonapodya prolifera (strain JEL478) TaxID=1344416 RepID=A0A139AI85_GONPJ|nr:hypothetical protein M427DRAFT_43577 [Gonapodya prolifera JEL478]|eukprot:KXS16500.1 hypothetical protein M427DRAFT_43577 [Gonapodya prolifera JEL478]
MLDIKKRQQMPPKQKRTVVKWGVHRHMVLRHVISATLIRVAIVMSTVGIGTELDDVGLGWTPGKPSSASASGTSHQRNHIGSADHGIFIIAIGLVVVGLVSALMILLVIYLRRIIHTRTLLAPLRAQNPSLYWRVLFSNDDPLLAALGHSEPRDLAKTGYGAAATTWIGRRHHGGVEQVKKRPVKRQLVTRLGLTRTMRARSDVEMGGELGQSAQVGRDARIDSSESPAPSSRSSGELGWVMLVHSVAR